jgi:hypothetical protein
LDGLRVMQATRMSKKTTNDYDLIMICMTIYTVPDLLICFKPGEAAYAIFVMWRCGKKIACTRYMEQRT